MGSFRSGGKILWIVVWLLLTGPLFAQHDHDHGEHKAAEPVKRPKVFLDKSPRVVAYQLKRLNNERLLLVERKDDDAKYIPVWQAILVRDGMSPQYREEALQALVSLKSLAAPTSAAKEVLAAIEDMDEGDRQQRRTASELARLVLDQDANSLSGSVDVFQAATSAKHGLKRSVGFAGLIAAGQNTLPFAKDDAALVAMLESLALLPQANDRNAMRQAVVDLLANPSPSVSLAAITALGLIPENSSDSFRRLAPFVTDPDLRTAAVRSMLEIPNENRDSDVASTLVDSLVKLAEATPAAERTSEAFIDAMQLADQLFARLPVDLARSYRQRLREVTVRVIQIHTIEEEMRYDIPYFVVEAGRPVQVVLKNEDLMPHNLVITTDGSLQQVAELGLQAGPTGTDGKQYVPDSPDVLFATNMVPPGGSERLTFTAPAQPGTYPYVCTFPRHWMRMYGVMLVVEDLDEWTQNPVVPADPLGSKRMFVQNWKIDDFADDLAAELKASDPQVGQQLFTEATCAQCHQADGQGGQVGPSLNGVFARWKNDHAAVLREVLEPSHRIDAKYAVHLIVTDEGQTFSGIVAADDKKTVSILANPESKELTVIKKDSIEEMVKTSTSMMPKGLLDRYQRNEVLDLLAYLGALEEK